MQASRTGKLATGAAILLFVTTATLVEFVDLAASRYTQKNLTADVGTVAESVNPALVSPWGMVLVPSGLWLLADNNQGVIISVHGASTTHSAADNLTIKVPLPPGDYDGLPSSPTGIVYNRNVDFEIATGKPARLIIVTEEGTLSGWNPEVDKNKAILIVDHSDEAVYKGITSGLMQGNRYIYAADFFGGSIDVFDTYFHEVHLQRDAFVDPELPRGYAPFNVQYIGGKIYVTYALQDGDHYDAIRGAGFGSVSVFDSSGKFISRLKSGPELNAPWGIAIAPPGFGTYANMLLIGNAGDGTIAVYDPATGEFRGLLKGLRGDLIMIQGLRGIAAGNEHSDASAVYFCAGIEEGKYGLFGLLKPGPLLDKYDR